MKKNVEFSLLLFLWRKNLRELRVAPDCCSDPIREFSDNRVMLRRVYRFFYKIQLVEYTVSNTFRLIRSILYNIESLVRIFPKTKIESILFSSFCFTIFIRQAARLA